MTKNKQAKFDKFDFAAHVQCKLPFSFTDVKVLNFAKMDRTRSSADADNGLDAFSGQSRSTNMVPFWVHCGFSLSM